MTQEKQASTIPKYMRVLGKVKAFGRHYILDFCPLCGGEKTFKFLGTSGLWECPSCSSDTYRDFKELKQLLLQNEVTHDLVSQMGEPEKPKGLKAIGQFHAPKDEQEPISTGFNKIDRFMGGFALGGMTVLTGATGEGKSTWSGQLALNTMEDNNNVCFYSGELTTQLFQEWIFSQAAGDNYMMPEQDRFGETVYKLDPQAEARIRQWMGERFIVYDNEIIKRTEQSDIITRFEEAHKFYGCKFFVVDNLMSAKSTMLNTKDYWQSQANFAQYLLDFAKYYKVHVLLIAHPKKGVRGDDNADVAGLATITNMAWNVMSVRRLSEEDKRQFNLHCDSLATITKNRVRGGEGKIQLLFEPMSRRLVPTDGRSITKYSWEDMW